MWASLDIIQREYGGQSELFTGRLSFLWLLRLLILSRGPCESFSNAVLALKSTQPAPRGTGPSQAYRFTVTGLLILKLHRNHCICSKLRTQQSLSQQVRCRGLALLSCSSRKHPPSSSRTSGEGIRTQVCDESQQTLTLPVLHPSCVCVCVCGIWFNKQKVGHLLRWNEMASVFLWVKEWEKKREKRGYERMKGEVEKPMTDRWVLP